MIVTLENNALIVKIEDVGAQLASIRDRQGTEYLWQGNPDIWPRRAPLLFPVVGRLQDQQYSLQGKTYPMGQHGFVRTAPFSVVEQGRERVSFRYADTPETREIYPFSFALTVTYALEENRLVKSHLVENRSDVPMPYELGGHDGYRIPLRDGERMSDYAVRVPGLDAITPYGEAAGKMIAPKDKTYPLEDGRIAVRPSDYGLDTIILDELPERKALLVDKDNQPRVAVDFADFPYLGIWTAAKEFDTNYVCIEPWTTLPDAVFVGRELAEKQGIRILQPGQSETLSYTVTFT